MAIDDALTILGTWPAALAVGADEPWTRVCAHAARQTRCPHKQAAWNALARHGRRDVAGRLNAAGIRI